MIWILVPFAVIGFALVCGIVWALIDDFRNPDQWEID